MVFFEVVKLGFSGMVNLFEGLLSVKVSEISFGVFQVSGEQGSVRWCGEVRNS